MPSPIAHSVTGYVLARLLPLTPCGRPCLRRRYRLALGLVAANAADLDFIGEFLQIASHRGFTHSLVCLVGVSLAVSWLGRQWHLPRRQLLLFVGVIYGSHLLLDSLTAGGPGMLLLWPFSPEYYGAPWRIFPAVRHQQGLFYAGHGRFIRFELIYGLLLVAGLGIGQWLGRHASTARSSR